MVSDTYRVVFLFLTKLFRARDKILIYKIIGLASEKTQTQCKTQMYAFNK